MKYYIGNIPYGNDLTHFGIKGMHWGVRRYQNSDGTLTAAGKARYEKQEKRRLESAERGYKRLESGDDTEKARKREQKRHLAITRGGLIAGMGLTIGATLLNPALTLGASVGSYVLTEIADMKSKSIRDHELTDMYNAYFEEIRRNKPITYTTVIQDTGHR